MTQTSGPAYTGYAYFNRFFTFCQDFFNKKEYFPPKNILLIEK